jgi:hypothetical protein
LKTGDDLFCPLYCVGNVSFGAGGTPLVVRGSLSLDIVRLRQERGLVCIGQ